MHLTTIRTLWLTLATLGLLGGPLLARHRRVERRLEAALDTLAEQNERLRELDELKDEFVASVSHELRTPLTAIVAYVELLQDEEPGPLTAEQREFLEVMDRSAQRLRRLVDDLLLLGRMDAGRFSVQKSPVGLAELVAAAVADATLQARRAKVSLLLEAEEVEPFLADRSRLAQAVDNLISNALRFTPEGGSVVVRAGGDGEVAFVEVEDTGVGIAPEERELVFGRFFRGAAPENASVSGSGIGLTIVKAVAEAHGGAVSVGEGEAGGAVLRMEIPMVEAPAATGPIQEEAV